MKKKLITIACLLATTALANAETHYALNEGFEEWDSMTSDWVPAGWTEQISDEKLYDLEEGRFTWHVGTDTGTLPSPPQGSAYAMIYYAYETDADGKKHDLPQDEWLITPTINVQSDATLSFKLGYSPLFLFDLNNENVDWGSTSFVNKKPSTNLQIYIRQENDNDWTELMNLYEEWEDYTLSDLFNNYFDNTFRSYELPIDDKFANSNIQIAFRYVGMYGNTMELDDVKVTDTVTSVSSHSADRNNTTLSINADEYKVISTCANYLDIYALTGGKIASINLNDSNEILRSSLPKGALIFRFDDGTVIKTIN